MSVDSNQGAAFTPAEAGPLPELRLITTPLVSPGAWNMAVDEALLETAAADGPTTLRLYRWSEATVSLGYFQREHPEIDPGGRFAGLAAVRRLSGGGAILHHHELTYSCCLPASHPLAASPGRLYEEMHAAIARALATFGITVRPRGAAVGDDKTFLCFSRGDRRDLVCNGSKVVGSAQRRRGGAVLQHGSILLRRSEFAPEFPGVEDLAKRELNAEAFQSEVERECCSVLGDSIRRESWSSEEDTRARALAESRYARVVDRAAAAH